MPYSSRCRLARWGVAAAVFVAVAGAPAMAVKLSLKPDARDALVVDGARATVAVRVLAEAPEDHGAYELRQTFVDRYGRTTTGPTLRIQLDREWRDTATVPVEHFGPATYRVALYKAGADTHIARAEQMLVRPVPVPRLSREQRARSPMGVNVHANARWETLGAMGVHWARDYSWGWLGRFEQWPKAANKTDFAPVEPAADRAGITILPVMQRVFRTEDKKAFIDDGDAIAAAYERYSRSVPQLKHWELDNEADLEHRDQTTDAYRKWLASYLGYVRHADRGLDAAGHGAKVVLNGEAGIHVERTRQLIDAVGDHFAVVNYHFYTGTIAPELALQDINTGGEDRPRTISFLDQLREVNAVAHAAGKEAWLTEFGWSARSGPAIGDQLQSAYLQRMYLLSRWAGTDKAFWFWDRELPPGGRFSSTELVHKDEGARPAGAAMAAVSKFTALAEYAGSIEVGPGRWALAFKRPEGGWLVAAWAVTSEHALPEPLARAAESFDMYGNPLRDPKLTVAPAYFHLPALPKAWEDRLSAEWLSPSVVNIYQGDRAEVEARVPGSATMAWQDLPTGVEGSTWRLRDGRQHAILTAAPTAEAGTRAATAAAKGDGWEKRFPLSLVVRPGVDVDAEPYTAGEAAPVRLTNMLSEAVEATLTPGSGEVRPTTAPVAAGTRFSASFTAPVGATEPIALAVKLRNGATQRHWIRPRHLAVPRVGTITLDGDLSDWPAGGTLLPNALKVTGPEVGFQPQIKLAWSLEGLYVSAVIHVGSNFTPPSKPQEFWEWTGVEMNLDAADATAEPGVSRSHLLYFTPTQDRPGGPWRVFAGEWLKPMPDGKKQTINDDPRPRTAARYDGTVVTVEALVPVEVLGAAPRAGAQWPLTISAKVSKALSPRTLAAWPVGSAPGPAGWGRVTFVE